MVVACATLIIALDTSFMNVSISQISANLNTDVSTIQMIVSFYHIFARTPRPLRSGMNCTVWEGYTTL